MLEILDTDLLIVGGGVAGTVAAIKAAENGVDVLLVEKATVGWAGQATMSGGVVWVVKPDDDLEAWAGWQVRKGDYLCDQDWVYAMAERSLAAVQEVAAWGAPFWKDEAGAVRLFKLPSFPDSYWGARFDAGTFMRPLRRRAVAAGVKIIDKVQMVELLKDGERAAGAVGFGVEDARPVVVRARSTVLANGSCDFKVERLFSASCGEGVAMAYLAGAEMRNAEFGNLYAPRMEELDTVFRGPLMSYARNALGELICEKYLSSEESAEFGLMVQGMVREVEAGRGPIGIDFAELPPGFDDVLRPVETDPSYPERLLAKFGEIGALPNSSMIELVPAFVGKLSPVKVDLHFRTTVPGLFALGDTSHLGSSWEGAIPAGEVPGPCIAYALISGLVGGAEAARAAQESELPHLDLEEVSSRLEALSAPLHRAGGVSPADALYRLQELVYPTPFSLFRCGERLRQALGGLEHLQAEIDSLHARNGHELARCHEVTSMALCAEMMLRSALARTESRGSHLREDYRARDDVGWLRWVVVRREQDRMDVSTEKIPMERYRLKPEARKPPWATASSGSNEARETAAKLEDTASLISGGSPIEQVEIETAGISFLDLKDRKVALAAFQGHVVVVAGGARTATEGSKRWGEILEREYGSDREVRLFRLAAIENLPRFVPRSLVKGQMGKDSAVSPMLIDWDGRSKGLIDPQRRDEPHVWVLDQQGHIRLRLAAEPSEGGLRALKEAIVQLRRRD